MQKFTLQDIDSEKLKNFFNIFGFVKISGFFSDEIKSISKDFDTLMSDKFGSKKSKNRNYFYPQFIEHSENLTNLLEREKIVTLTKNLLGEDPIYTGSDGNIFAGSTPWHRDYLIKNRSCKILFYLDKIDGNSGALRVIPGSHFTDDKYSSYLGDGLTWPEPPYEGGFDEKGLFGKGHNPTKYRENNLIPNYVVETEPGDVIVFNHNIIHCTNYTLKTSFLPSKLGFKKKNVRKMFGVHFFSSPNNIKDKKLQKDLRTEIEELFLIEMESFKLEKRFGPYVQDTTSKIINNFTKEIIHLRYKSEDLGSFDGKYTKQSDNSMAFGNRLKLIHYNNNQETN